MRLGKLRRLFLGFFLACGWVAAEGPAVKVDAVVETDAAHPGTTVRGAVEVTLGANWHVNAHEPLDEFLVPTALTMAPSPGLSVRETAYPQPETIVLGGLGDALAVYSEHFTVGLLIAVAPDAAPGEYAMSGKLIYQACDNKQCLPPASVEVILKMRVAAAETPLTPQRPELFAALHFAESTPPVAAEPAPEPESTSPESKPEPSVAETGGIERADAFRVAGKTSGYLKTSEFLAFLDRVERGEVTDESGRFSGKSAWLVIVLALVGGLLLNLTPCVLPLIPINLAIIGAGAKARSKSRGFLLGGAYGLGIALSYGALGLVVVLGLVKTFGAINATPWFNAIIAVVFVLLALAMFDVFLLDFTRFQTRFGAKRSENGSFVAAFLMGVVAALLAGACVAPVILSAIVYAQDQYAKGHTTALGLPFLLGVGMALPWPLAGAGLGVLPKPGRWMDRVRQAFGVFILLLAVYYGHLAYMLFSDRYLTGRVAAPDRPEDGWGGSLSEGLAQAEREGKPVFVDFWATWCKNCLVMNDTTFRDKVVLERLAPYVRVKFQAENPADPATKEAMERFDVIGLPTYMVLEPSEGGARRPGQ